MAVVNHIIAFRLSKLDGYTTVLCYSLWLASSSYVVLTYKISSYFHLCIFTLVPVEYDDLIVLAETKFG